MVERTSDLVDIVSAISHPLTGADDLDPLMDLIGDARFVLIGEASHGTSEYYTWRAGISRRLIEERGFSFIAVEGDWPDCYSVNRYVKGYAEAGASAVDVLSAFNRWPTWMWANWEIVAMSEWLRRFNDSRPDESKIGFYGLDVYSLWESMEAILSYLQDKDPSLVEVAYRAFSCFEPYNRDVQDYAFSTMMVPTSCEDEVVDLLREIRAKRPEYPDDREAKFDAEQNALIAVNAERYYRAMVRSDANSWNIRDRHMAETLDRLCQFHGPDTKAIVWEHNTHIGDARATDMAPAGMVNVGQLVRQAHSDEGVVLVGFGSYRGSVIAGARWGAPMERMEVPPGREGSWEDVMHQAGDQEKLMILPEMRQNPQAIETRGHRAIGVVYHPERERFGNYVPTNLPYRYDAFMFLNETQALSPLHMKADIDQPEPPDTYPWGF